MKINAKQNAKTVQKLFKKWKNIAKTMQTEYKNNAKL